jgi:Protein of unknown function (DUF2637)
MITWGKIMELAGQVPPSAWAVLAVANLLITIATWSVTRRRLRLAGQRAAHPDLVAAGDKGRDTALTVAALIPAGFFWSMVMAGSLRGLVAFGRTVLNWHGASADLVPGTLDGVSVAFVFLAFRAVRLRKSPDRCHRVVWGASLASAVVNFSYEYGHTGHNLVAGGYQALLSLFGVVIFHEFFSQFEDDAQTVRRRRPRYGLRWLTSPYSTCCAVIAWENYPPAKNLAATVHNGLANLDRVRQLKQSAAEQRIAEQHARDLATAERQAQLAAASAAKPASTRQRVSPPRPRPPDQPVAPAPIRNGVDVRLPQTVDTVRQWIDCWMALYRDGLADAPISNHMAADCRRRYGWSIKQLRYVRRAAQTGALRRQASLLGVALPANYTDRPSSASHGRELVGLTGVAGPEG